MSWTQRVAGLCVCMFMSMNAIASDRLEFHVSPTGHDGNSGDLKHPLLTLTMARNLLRDAKHRGNIPPEGAVVWLHDGTYSLTETFFLEAEDSGTASGPISYAAAPGEKVRLVGGVKINSLRPLDASCALHRIPAAVRSHIVYTNLLHSGVREFGELAPRSAMRPLFPASLEVFCNGTPLTLARWPNRGWGECLTTSVEHPEHLHIPVEQANRWKTAPDAWFHGGWLPEQCDSFERVVKINEKVGSVKFQPAEPPPQVTTGTRYKAFNLLEELDEPGEWYLDRQSGYLYLWPTSTSPSDELLVSTVNTLVCCDNVAHVEFHDLTFECARVSGVELLDGEANCLRNCCVRNIGNLGVNIVGGVGHCLEHCHITHTGDGGIRLEGGSQEQEHVGKHAVHNCRIEHYSRSGLAYRAGIFVYGYGNSATGNQLNQGPEPAILSFGEKHIVAENVVQANGSFPAAKQ